jgi:hypothetical protein
MGFKGFVRDLLGIYIGFRLLLQFVFPLSNGDELLLGGLLFGFSSWLVLKKVNVA